MITRLVEEAIEGGNLKLAGMLAFMFLDGSLFNLQQNIVPLSVTFESGDAGQTLCDTPNNDIVKCGMFWVRDMVYTIRRPNAFPCSVNKAESDSETTKSPFIDLRLTVAQQNQLLYRDIVRPIEHIARASTLEDAGGCCGLPTAFILTNCAYITGCFTLKRNLCSVEGNSELPYEVELSLRGISLSIGTEIYLRMTHDLAMGYIGQFRELMSKVKLDGELPDHERVFHLRD